MGLAYFALFSTHNILSIHRPQQLVEPTNAKKEVHAQQPVVDWDYLGCITDPNESGCREGCTLGDAHGIRRSVQVSHGGDHERPLKNGCPEMYGAWTCRMMQPV